MKLLLAAMLYHFSAMPKQGYFYTQDDKNPDNRIVWDDEGGYKLYDENTKHEAVALTALLNMGLPYQFSALESVMADAVTVLDDPHVQRVMTTIEEYEKENAAEALAEQEAEDQRALELQRRRMNWRG